LLISPPPLATHFSRPSLIFNPPLLINTVTILTPTPFFSYGLGIKKSSFKEKKYDIYHGVFYHQSVNLYFIRPATADDDIAERHVLVMTNFTTKGHCVDCGCQSEYVFADFIL